MPIEQAVEILKEFIQTDRRLRNNKVESDFDIYCEKTCVAIETVLNELYNK